MQVKCTICNREVYRTPSSYKQNITGKFYCCPEHQRLGMRFPHLNFENNNINTSIAEHIYQTSSMFLLPCKVCGKEVHRSPSRLSRNNGIVYCSKSCHAKDHMKPDSNFKKGLYQYIDKRILETFYRTKKEENRRCFICCEQRHLVVDNIIASDLPVRSKYGDWIVVECPICHKLVTYICDKKIWIPDK